MTGQDLLDAIGYVDEELLEHCQEAQQNTAKSKISWFWYGRKYASIAACACLFLIFILGITYWQYNLSGVGDSLLNEEARRITALLDVQRPEETTFLQGSEDEGGADSARTGNSSNGTDSSPQENSPDEVAQDLKAGSIYDTANQAGGNRLPDADESYGREGHGGGMAGESGNTDISPSADTQIAKIDGTDIPGYSKGIEIQEVKAIPDREPQQKSQPEEPMQPEEPSQPDESLQPDETVKPDEVVSVKKILAEDTTIIRGTVKKVQYFHAFGRQIDVYFSVVFLKVKEVYRADGKGGPKKGSICKVCLPDINDAVHTDTTILNRLKKGREAVIMPYIADTKTGIHNAGEFFAFSDVAEYYFDAKTAESHIFLKTKTGIRYNTKIYDIPHNGKKVTLDDVGSFIRNELKIMRF